MSLEDGHFRTDGKTFELCCKGMKFALSIGTKICGGCDRCPFCGAELEYVEKVKQ